MSVSGVKLAPEAVITYDNFKKSTSGVAFFILNIVEGNIVVEEEVRIEQIAELLAKAKEEGFSQTATEPESYALLRSRILKRDACYAIVVLKYQKDGPRDSIVSINWTNNDASNFRKLTFSTSFGAVTRGFAGMNHRIEASDQSEIAYENVLKIVMKS